MSEKIISEIRFIETDDGFRIEFKGDKERWREMGFGPGPWRGGRSRRRGHGHHGHGHHSHHGHHRHGCESNFGPWGWWGQWDEEPPKKA